MVAESWLRNLWKTHKKHDSGPQLIVGVLAFEVASLMSKLLHLWRSLSDKHVTKLREDIANSVGIKKLISDEDAHIVRFISSEIVENLGHVAKAVTRLSKKCNDPCLKSFEHVFSNLIMNGADPYGWTYTWKKLDKKTKKMERFISVNSNLYQGMESLSELDHTLARMKTNGDLDKATLTEYEKKVAWKHQEVKHLKDFSLWNRSYDYVVRLLARSVFTIYKRIGYVFGIGPVVDFENNDSKIIDSDYIFRSQSVSTMMPSSVHPSENNSLPRFSSGPLFNTNTKTNGLNNYHSGPLGISKTRSSPIRGENKSMNFYSGPLKPSTTKAAPLKKSKKSVFKLWSKHQEKNPIINNNHFENVSVAKNSHLAIMEPKQKWLNAPPETLGAAALALHYANLIIVIEKLVATPHLIGIDARDDLYNMLPFSVRSALKAKLKPYSKNLNSSIYDSALAGEWSEAMSGILEWLAPLAHNTIRWQTERSFEHQNSVPKTNVLLVQTLYFANQEKTEATITELLIGLNYVWRYGRELNAKALMECTSGRTIDSSFEVD